MRKLYRSTRDRKLFGVCGGLSEYLGVDATLLRILLIIVTVFSAGSVVFVYIIAGFVIPREPYGGGPFAADPFGSAGGWRPPQGGWTPPPQQHAPHAEPAWSHTPPPWAGTRGPSAGSAPRPASPRPASAAADTAAPELDAMMEDIEKKALKKEIEDLKARITKFEQQSKGE
ncbi:PspC domain-containing protein [Cohnella nanjingensis]|uniref:PspC domain-containing protein n=1 Tax=Cohnella nanjingensis TaxID=1387779 RepID=A0A7X0RYU7_9BACL|nr:PspC domain-containing protein [Cohnella nanjingensis]MBB6674986.1 PspC domain-containing protein [Cohnella nanjingensis]